MANQALLSAPALGRRRPVVRARQPAGNTGARDSAWFLTVYESTFESVYRYALMLVRDPDRAEDVAADVYLRAWRARESFTTGGAPTSWLLTITHNTALSMLRAKREVADLSLISERQDTSADPEAGLLAEADAVRVRQAIRELTAEQQQVVFLRFFQGLRHDAVAERLGRTPNAVRAIQFRALARLRKLLEV